MGDSSQPPVDHVMRYVKLGALCSVMVPVLSVVLSYALFPGNDASGKSSSVASVILTTILVSISILPFGIWVGAIVGDLLQHRRDRDGPNLLPSTNPPPAGSTSGPPVE